MHQDTSRLFKQLNYVFNNKNHLRQALTHCSAGLPNNERLEFLGDSILNFVIAHAVFEKFPTQSEGELSRLRAYLVNGDMLAKIALEINLGDSIYLGQGELKSGGFRRASILADALEAIFAAVFLDGGFEASRQTILHLYQTRLDDKQILDNIKDAKTQLQEYVQAQKHPLPKYKLIKTTGDEHNQEFHVVCEISALNITMQAQATTRRKAEQNAAKAILNKLSQDNR